MAARRTAARSEMILRLIPAWCVLDPAVAKIYRNRREHDPSDLAGARELAECGERVAIGLFFHDPAAVRYEEFTTRGLGMTADEKLGALDRELDRFAP